MNEIIFPEVNSLTCLRKIPSSGTSAAHCEVKKMKVYSVNQREWRRTDRLRMAVGIPTLPLTDLETQLRPERCSQEAREAREAQS